VIAMPMRALAATLLLLAAPLLSAAPVVRDAWLRAAPPVAGMSAGYLTLDNAGGPADALVAVEVEGVRTVELHEMAHAGGMMTMRQVGEIAVPADGSVTLAPGGLHLMLIGLERPLVAGETRRVVLRLREQGEVIVELDVAGIAPATH
jgi:copper(I)-binding protein